MTKARPKSPPAIQKKRRVIVSFGPVDEDRERQVTRAKKHLGCTHSSGRWRNNGGGQSHFRAGSSNWSVTMNLQPDEHHATAGSSLWIDFEPSSEEALKTLIGEISAKLGWPINDIRFDPKERKRAWPEIERS